MDDPEVLTMVEIAQIFQDSIFHVLMNMLDEDRSIIASDISIILLSEKPYMLLTYEGILRITDLVFSKENIRDFILNLHFVFFSRLGNSKDYINTLINNLAFGISLNSGSEFNCMPDDISKRLVKETNANDILNGNKWLIIILMIHLFVDLLTIKKMILVR